MPNYSFEDIKQSALGQWPDILRAFGIEPIKEGKNVPCLLCGGHDRAFWKYTGGKVMQHCRHCGSHFADQLLLELCFNGDFAQMCRELGDYLHCQPSERQQQVRTQAKISESSSIDLATAQEKISAATKFSECLVKKSTHPILIRYGIGADCYTLDSGEIAFPMKISGQLVDWLIISNAGQSVLSGSLLKGAKLVIKPEGQFNKIFVTPDLIDAYYLFQIGRQSNIVICCGALQNILPVINSLPQSREIIIAVENSLDALDALQTIPAKHGFIMPDEDGRKFCEIGYRFKPKKIHAGGESGAMYQAALKKAGI